jgi:hypothetical protein
VKRYIRGYYCRDDSDLELLNKSSNRYILDELNDAYPSGMTAHKFEEKTQLPRQTIYSQVKELCRESYTVEINNRKSKPRGRPSKKTDESSSRHRDEVIIEHSGLEGDESIFPLPPGNIELSDDFKYLWNETVEKDEVEEISSVLMNFINRIFRRVAESEKSWMKKEFPAKHVEHCCYQCGLNHEGRDFIRALLIRTIDAFEASRQYLDFMKENDFLTQEAYDYADKEHKNLEMLLGKVDEYRENRKKDKTI